jgi:phosphoglycolate phosphatase
VTSSVLLFDLDGTLTDPRLGIVRCMRYALDRLGKACPSDDVLATFIGPPLRVTFSSLLESADKELIEKAMSLYRERFAETGIYENQLYDGVTDMLAS